MILERSEKSKTGYKGVWQNGSNSFAARYAGKFIGNFRTASEAAIAYHRQKKESKRGGIEKLCRTFSQNGSKRTFRDNGVLKDALSTARESLPLSENGVPLIRSNCFSGYHMVNVQAGARRQMLAMKSFHIPFVKPFYVEGHTSSGKHFLGSFETNVAAAVCVTEFLRQHNVRQSPPNKNVKGVPELRRSTRHSESVSKSYADEEGDVNFCVIGENNSGTADDSACLHWVQ